MLKRHRKSIKLVVDNGAQNRDAGKLVDEVTVGSVTIPIFYSRNRVKTAKKKTATNGHNGSLGSEVREYDSFIVPYYEGSLRKTPRRSTLEKARAFAKDTATRLNRDGARAEFLSEKDRRIFVLAKASAQSLGMEVDALCRKHVELTKRLKNGTLEQAVDFTNDHGQRVRHGVATGVIYDEYVVHLAKRGVGNYHERDTRRYVGSFVETFPGAIGPIETGEIDDYLASRGGKARNKNNHRDAIIGFYNFAEQKGYLPYGVPHAASLTTEFRDARQKILTEAQAREMLQPKDIYLPVEMAALLAAAKEHEPEILPSLEIKAFSGVRTEEISRLWWIMVCEKEQLIRVPDAVGKIDARRVPILPNLISRLQAHPEEIKRDRVTAEWATANSLSKAWKRVCKIACVPYRRNAFRNSYFTYRLAILGDPKQVAQEGGTSERELKKNYLSRAPVSRDMAEAWFAL